MRILVAVVICAVLAVPAWAFASSAPGALVRTAAQRSGLPVRAPVRTATVSAARYGQLVAHARSGDYPGWLSHADALLGLAQPDTQLPSSRAWYDAAAKRLFLQRKPAAPRTAVLNEIVRALVDQNYGLRRVSALLTHDHDRWLAARGIVDGTAALASGVGLTSVRGTPLDRFMQLEANVGTGPGRTLAAQLRSIGGTAAVASALHRFPQTTEQLLHIDKFLEREPALPVRLPPQAGPATLTHAETFGELDVRNLLQAFAISSAASAAAGWGGGRLALYDVNDDQIAALVLRWDSPADALEWQTAAMRYVAAAFPGATPATCPPLDRCWTGTGDVAAGVLGTTTVLASGPGANAVASALLTLK